MNIADFGAAWALAEGPRYAVVLGTEVRTEEVQATVVALQQKNLIRWMGRGSYSITDPFVHLPMPASPRIAWPDDQRSGSANGRCQTLLACSLAKAAGVRPVQRLNARLKLRKSLKPSCSATTLGLV